MWVECVPKKFILRMSLFTLSVLILSASHHVVPAMCVYTNNPLLRMAKSVNFRDCVTVEVQKELNSSGA